MDSILESVKKLLGIQSDETSFNEELVICINSAFDVLRQIGIGPSTGYSITGTDDTWTEFFGDGKVFESVKTYIFLKVKLLFDPPPTSFVLDAFARQISESEWRLSAEASAGLYSSEQPGEVP